ncbi:MAG: NUDIX domain-containing protein [Thermomicrobiales bacterium]|nr:NUDIX domain-containing protein [Thermomicrobiales bacterium]
MSGPSAPTRDFTVAVFVVSDGKVLLHFHKKLQRWLPPGGHIEPGELPDSAAVREVLEETGIHIRLSCDQLNEVAAEDQPRQLCRPAGIQLAQIRPGHEHIDLIYFATAVSGALTGGAGWYGPESWPNLQLTDEVMSWCRSAVDQVDR